MANSYEKKVFSQHLNSLTNKGLRVIAFGYKLLDQTNLTREQVEKDLLFLGLFVLENKLKPDTSSVI